MDARPATADSKHHYPPQLRLWNSTIPSPAVQKLSSGGLPPSAVSVSLTSASVTSSPQPDQSPAHFPSHIDLLPILFPQQSSLYHAQLLQYNKLIAPGRGRGGGLQTPPLPPLLSTPSVHVGPRSRSSSKVSNKDLPTRAKPGTQNCHGNRGLANNTPSKGDRAVITGKDKMAQPPRKAAADVASPPRPAAVPTTAPASLAAAATQQAHSNSVPSTPHQHPRTFSFESREPSPNANHGHSPRSAYSETNGNVPSLRPLPPRMSGCKFETATERYRRRIPYSVGDEKLEKSDLDKIKSKLSEDEERKLTTDMRELYDRLKPTSAVEEKRYKLVQKLERMLNDAWPGCDIRVNLFGSSGNKLCSDDSDVDICITTPWKELEKVCKLAELLANNGMEKVVCVGSAKVPIVKIWDPELELACDMNVNNTLALENTRMIRTYVEIDERVRPLAMIIKYWTRRRVINDAAFGATLSSYTWICMIIAFLQLRQPPIVPSLHQRPQSEMSKKEGDIAPFADDLEHLRGYGKDNDSTLGELLFQFFRFYAHEFDYDKWALSVRLGKLMPKTERKSWILATNNRLCVEEPFNTMRNLGNTADDTSFRGIHMELRRAFDFISEGKLDECCAQYIFPKEEEKVWQKPAPRPVLLRSASQQHSRGGRAGASRGGRQQSQYRNNNHGNNRRASSSTPYDNAANMAFYPGYGFVGPDGVFMDASQTLSALQLQENNLRFLAYTQQQAMAQQAAIAQAQRMQGNVSSPSQTSTERSRTNSFDNPPLTAPIRPEMWYWQQQFQAQQQYFTTAAAGFTSYPSSPSSVQPADQRRTSHRSSAASEIGLAATGSSLRSQSQPASRQPMPATLAHNPVANGVTSVPARQLNGRTIPSFMPDESNDVDQESNATRTPPSEDKFYGNYLEPSASPARRPSGLGTGVPAFGDLAAHGPAAAQNGHTPASRRKSSDQFPQAILDRIKRTSRSPSPSPLGHTRNLSGGTSAASVTSAPSQTNGRLIQETTPLVVNGSASKGPNASAVRHPLATDAPTHLEGPSGNVQVSETNGVAANSEVSLATSAKVETLVPERPLVVNGSYNASLSTSQPPSRHGNEATPSMTNSNILASPVSQMASPTATQVQPNSLPPLSVPSQSQSHLIPQHDLAADRATPADSQHLSPVYEITPSPTVTRKFELPTHPPKTRPSKEAKDAKGTPKSPVDVPAAKVEAANSHNLRLNGMNGHARVAKGEGEAVAVNGWQKIGTGKGRKKGTDGRNRSDMFPQSEQLPKNESERKGG